MKLGRRGFLGSAFALGAVGVLGARKASASEFGELVADPDGILDLPPGFSYKIVARRGDPTSDGYRFGGKPDGMGCFKGTDNTLILLCNHENSGIDLINSPVEGLADPPAEAFDPLQSGGVSRIVLDADTLETLSTNLVLFGSQRNCGGGMSPWGWITCEESKDSGHGYSFLCPPDAHALQKIEPIRSYGRYNHEAAVVDPDTLTAYLTEDSGNSSFYRLVPDNVAAPFEGTLQALKVAGKDRYLTGSEMSVGERLDVEWVDIDEPDPDDGADTVATQAQAKGAALFVRGEGIAYYEGDIYFCATSGGPANAGQIFRLEPDGDGGVLELLGQSEDRDVLDMPDNIIVSPWGDVYMAEDGGGEQYVRILTKDGKVQDFARNAHDAGEFAGVCFSPDGQVMFVNIQLAGFTLAITGPFPAADTTDYYYGPNSAIWASKPGDSSSVDGGDGNENGDGGAGTDEPNSGAPAAAGVETSDASGCAVSGGADASWTPAEVGVGAAAAAWVRRRAKRYATATATAPAPAPAEHDDRESTDDGES